MKTEKEQIKILKNKLATLKRWNKTHGVILGEEPQITSQFTDEAGVLRGSSSILYIELKGNVGELKAVLYLLPERVFQDVHGNTYKYDEVEYWCYRHNEPYRFFKGDKQNPDGRLQPIIKEYRDYWNN